MDILLMNKNTEFVELLRVLKLEFVAAYTKATGASASRLLSLFLTDSFKMFESSAHSYLSEIFEHCRAQLVPSISRIIFWGEITSVLTFLTPEKDDKLLQLHPSLYEEVHLAIAANSVSTLKDVFLCIVQNNGYLQSIQKSQSESFYSDSCQHASEMFMKSKLVGVSYENLNGFIGFLETYVKNLPDKSKWADDVLTIAKNSVMKCLIDENAALKQQVAQQQRKMVWVDRCRDVVMAYVFKRNVTFMYLQ
jgi:hypothetical protein